MTGVGETWYTANDLAETVAILPRSEEDDEGGALLGEVPSYPATALPAAAAELVRRGEQDGLPPALIAGAVLAAGAAAIGGSPELVVASAWRERACIWPILMAPRGAGKSPAQRLALAPVRSYDQRLVETNRLAAALQRDERDDGPPPPPATIGVGDATLEALARHLAAGDGAALLDIDELSTLLRGVVSGEYKRGAGGDRSRLLSLWSGDPWRYVRVADGKRGRNGLDLFVPRPTVVICGSLQPPLHGLLGGEEDGLRPRWLPHLAELPRVDRLSDATVPTGWQTLLGRDLLPHRDEPRMWKFSPSGRRVFDRLRSEWKRAARGAETATVAGALVKADVHVARIALVLAELEAPGQGGRIDDELVERAAAIMDFVLDSWRALPEQGGLSLSRRDELLDRGVERLGAWLEEHGGCATRRELQRAHVAGARTGADLDELLRRYAAHHPGAVHEEGSRVVVEAPRRRPRVREVSPVATPPIHPPAERHGYAESGGVATGDTPAGDTRFGDTLGKQAGG
jgi:hypothetical protein